MPHLTHDDNDQLHFAMVVNPDLKRPGRLGDTAICVATDEGALFGDSVSMGYSSLFPS